MQFKAVAVALFASLALAQNLTGLPDCAVTCFEDNFVNSACADTDVACLCADTTFYNDVEDCVLTDCDTDDALTTLTWATNECANTTTTKREISKRSVPLFGRNH